MRGKDDRKDAIRIAEYAIRYQDKLVIYQEPSELLRKLDALLKVRESLVSHRVALENQIREAKSHDPLEYEILSTGYRVTLRTIAKSLSKIEDEIDQVIKANKEISLNVMLLTSIIGIGKQIAVTLILATNNFKSFCSANHLACYSGVVPFNNQSGVITKRPRVSKMANKNLKKLLHMAAMAAIRSDSELKAYYIRKVKEGKNKMSVINAIRNKLVHRIMSVINRKTPFLPVDDYFYQKRNDFSCKLT
jgi:transposase